MSLWQILWGRKWFIGLFVIGFMLLGFVMTGSRDRTYTAESLLILEDNSTSLSSALTRDDNAYVNPNTAVEVFGSRPVIEQVVERLALDQDPEFNPFLEAAQTEPSVVSKAIGTVWTMMFGPRKSETPVEELPADYIHQIVVERVEETVRFLIIPQTSLIHVRATTLDPQKSARLANAVAEAFLNDTLNSRLDSVDRVVSQLGDRLLTLRQDFHEKEQALQNFRNESEILDPSALGFMAAEIERLRERRRILSGDLEAATQLLLEAQALKELSGNAAQERISENPQLQALRASAGRSIDRMISEAQSRQQTLERQAIKLNTSIEKLEKRVDLHSERLLQLGQLERETEASGEIYEFSLRRLNELSVQADVETSGGRIVFAAHVPQTGDSRGRLRTMIILGVLGMIVSVTWVLIKEANNQILRSISDLKAMRPNARIVSLPKAPTKGVLWKREADLNKLLGMQVTPFSSGIRRLRASVLAKADNKPTAFLVASDLIGTGKSLMTLSLAWSLSHVNKKVLIISADGQMAGVIRPLHKTVAQNGLEDVLCHGASLEDAVISNSKLGSDLLLNSEQKNHLSTDLLELDNFEKLLELARERYDIILIDTLPVLAAPDALQVARHVDDTLFVVGCDLSSYDSFAESLNELLPGNSGSQEILVLYGTEAKPSVQEARYNKKLGVM